MSSPPFTVASAGVSFGGDIVLRAVDLVVPAGEFVALLGPNGSGKTTLLRAMLGLQPLSTGRIEAFGRPIGAFRDWRRIAYVPQHLLSTDAVPVSVAEVVGAGLVARHPRRRRAAVRSALERVGLEHRGHDSFRALSGGQQRRALIAAALVKGADALLLDEPSAGLDEEHVARLVETLRQESERGVTIVLVTHELGALSGLVTRCVVLAQGEGSTVRYDGPAPAPRTLRDPHGHREETAPPAERPWWEARP